MDDPPHLTQLFSLQLYRSIYLIGGGGKTSLMYALADSLVREGQMVISSTSTKIISPQEDQSKALVVSEHIEHVCAVASYLLPQLRHITVAHSFESGLALPDAKLCGFLPDAFAKLTAFTDYVLVEADGSAGRSLKAHAAHEPLVSPDADLVIAVIGADCVGLPLDGKHIHRAELFASVLGLPLGHIITACDVANIFFHSSGYLAKISDNTSVSVFISKVRSELTRQAAIAIANALRQIDIRSKIKEIVLGDIPPNQTHLAYFEAMEDDAL
jgi:probable selenium-dependent hydroxylase accessory protein YqeC